MIRSLRVLVVDDDPGVLEILQAYLESRGYCAETTGSGREALDALQGEAFDLVLCDIHMAGMNGFEFLRLARTAYPEMGIVLMTAYEETYPLSEALRAGADGYITKPFSLDKVSLLFEKAYWQALSRQDWWDERDDGVAAQAGF